MEIAGFLACLSPYKGLAYISFVGNSQGNNGMVDPAKDMKSPAYLFPTNIPTELRVAGCCGIGLTNVLLKVATKIYVHSGKIQYSQFLLHCNLISNKDAMEYWQR
mgnify:CR=1 FL=1